MFMNYSSNLSWIHSYILVLLRLRQVNIDYHGFFYLPQDNVIYLLKLVSRQKIDFQCKYIK